MSKVKSGGGIENELKYVLDLEGIDKVLTHAEKTIEIKQGYLLQSPGKSARIRESISTTISYEFTFKQKISPGVCVELDNSLTKEMFLKLSGFANCWVNKTRVNIQGWDIDIFRDQYRTPYFLMAEYEMPEKQKLPEQVLPLVREFLIYPVPRGDCRFSSKKLSDKKYSKKLLKKIYSDKINRETFK